MISHIPAPDLPPVISVNSIVTERRSKSWVIQWRITARIATWLLAPHPSNEILTELAVSASSVFSSRRELSKRASIRLYNVLALEKGTRVPLARYMFWKALLSTRINGWLSETIKVINASSGDGIGSTLLRYSSNRPSFSTHFGLTPSFDLDAVKS
jgi:hypothetical protein